MADPLGQIGLITRATNAALDAVLKDERDSESMYMALSYDSMLRARQISFWRRFLRERSLRIKGLHESNPQLCASLSSSFSVYSLVSTCKRGGVEPGCLEGILALSLGDDVPEADRVMEVFPPSWFVNPDEALCKRLFPKHTWIMNSFSSAGSFLVNGAMELWRWLVSSPQIHPLDEIVEEKRSKANMEEGFFARVQDGEEAALELQRLLRECTNAVTVHGCTVVTLIQLRKMSCDVNTALSWLCSSGRADPIFFSIAGKQNCGFCIYEKPEMKHPSFVSALLMQMHTSEELERLAIKMNGEIHEMEKKAKEYLRKADRSRALLTVRRKRRMEDSLQKIMDKQNTVEQLMNSITEAATNEKIVEICSDAVDQVKQMMSDNPDMKDASSIMDAVNDGIQNVREIDMIIAGEPEDLDEYEDELKSLGPPSPLPVPANKRVRTATDQTSSETTQPVSFIQRKDDDGEKQDEENGVDDDMYPHRTVVQPYKHDISSQPSAVEEPPESGF